MKTDEKKAADKLARARAALADRVDLARVNLSPLATCKRQAARAVALGFISQAVADEVARVGREMGTEDAYSELYGYLTAPARVPLPEKTALDYPHDKSPEAFAEHTLEKLAPGKPYRVTVEIEGVKIAAYVRAGSAPHGRVYGLTTYAN